MRIDRTGQTGPLTGVRDLFDVLTGLSADGRGYCPAPVVTVGPLTGEVTLNAAPRSRLGPS